LLVEKSWMVALGCSEWGGKRFVMPPQNQLNLPPSLLPKREQDEPVLTIQEQDADRTASEMFDEALKSARITSQEAAFLTGVSESLVRKWRSVQQREQPSFAQMLCLPAPFHIALHRVMNRRFGFGRAALRRLLDAAGDLMAVSE